MVDITNYYLVNNSKTYSYLVISNYLVSWYNIWVTLYKALEVQMALIYYYSYQVLFIYLNPISWVSYCVT